jgi:rubrerythrin
MAVFTASDIVEVAIRIEENGINFYKYAEKISRKKEAKKLFGQLAEAEIHHKKFFEKIFAGMEKSGKPEGYKGEFSAYLRSYVDSNIVFTKDATEKQFAKVKNTAAALDFAIQRELDSILYYHEIKRLVPASQHKTLDQIIEEERKHFLSLTEVKKSMA